METELRLRPSAGADRINQQITDTYAVRSEIVRVVVDAFDIYSSEPGFMNTIDPVSSPTLAVRAAPHDDLVMEEPGPYSAPIPGATTHA